MSIIDNDVDISCDSRRQCGQSVDSSADDMTVASGSSGGGGGGGQPMAKRCRLSTEADDTTTPTGVVDSDNNNSMTTPSIAYWLTRPVANSQPEQINQLCPEVFQIILAKYLKATNWRRLVPLRLVCKYWRNNIDSYLASRHGFQYTGRVTKGAPPPVMNYYEFNAMLSFYPNLRQLIVKNFTVSDHLVAILRQNVPHLERISLYGCPNLTWKGITILAVRFPQLKFIDVSNCELDENRLSILIENLQNLKIMNAINPGRDVTGQCLARLGPNIQDIWIGLNHLRDVNLALRSLVSGNGKNLVHFGLIVSNFATTDFSIITDNMKNLKSLKLTFGSYKSSSLKALAALKNLEFLVLAEDSRNDSQSVLTDDSLISVLKGCTQLRSLAIAGTKPNTCRFTHRSIAQIPQLCRHMEQIRFLNAHNLADETLVALASIPTLLVLHLSSMNGITDRGVSEFAKLATKARNFRVSDCTNITEEIIDAWIEVATRRSDERIKLFVEGINVTRDLSDLPDNLKLDIKKLPDV